MTPSLPQPPEDDPAAPRPPLWADGGMTLLVRPPGGGGRILRVARPYALIGRIASAEIRLDGRAVSSRHAYLHLDPRGVFAVDLASRTGTTFSPPDATVSAGWLEPGQALEVAGHRIELMDAHATARGVPGVPGRTDLLAEAGSVPLTPLTLRPRHEPHPARSLASELAFVGRAPGCGIRVPSGTSAARVHCALLRTVRGAYVIDLAGRNTWLNDRPLTHAAALRDGDLLAIGSALFDVLLRPSPTALVPWTPAPADPEPDLLALSPTAPPALSPQAQRAILAWMMGALQASQAESLRRQDEFQATMLHLVQQMHRDQHDRLAEHLERIERINRELAALRDELARRLPPAPIGPRPGPAPALPAAAVPRVPPPPTADNADAATSWLLDRVSALEAESRSTWRDLLGRLTGSSG